MLFVDTCEGSGTSRQVCNELGIEYQGFDIHQGFDYTNNLILDQLPYPADMVFSHPPYHNMIGYTKNEHDTSRCKSVDEYLSKSQLMLLNQREATKDGGIYTTLIGDQRKNGLYYSYQSDFIQLMPKNELLNVVIKLQHNCTSNNKVYSGQFIPIMHEYLLIWRKKPVNFWQVCLDLVVKTNSIISSTWRNLVRLVMMKLKESNLINIYAQVEALAANLIITNINWKAKIRQIMQKYQTQVTRGIWAI